MDWTFGTLLWSTLIFFFWFAVVWMFIAVFASILRRDMSGWAKAGWIALIVLLPFLGALIYLITKPPSAERDDLYAWDPATRHRPVNYGAADQVAKAAQLHDQGKISSDEYEYLKDQALSR